MAGDKTEEIGGMIPEGRVDRLFFLSLHFPLLARTDSALFSLQLPS